jgi:methyl-accepting chemotaxis protein
MQGMQKKYQRSIKNLIINPSYQFRYIFWLTSSGLALVLINSMIAYSYIQENYITLVELGPMTDEAKTQMYSELRHLILALGATSFLFILVVGILGLFLSHKTAGPMYHFKRVFEEIRSGKTQQRVRLRPGDEFREVAESFNQMMDTLKSRT